MHACKLLSEACSKQCLYMREMCVFSSPDDAVGASLAFQSVQALSNCDVCRSFADALLRVVREGESLDSVSQVLTAI